MEIRKFIQTPKAISKDGVWRCGARDPKKERMTKTSFPLGKRGYVLGNQWWWRVDQLQIGHLNSHLLIAFRADKNNYQALLSIEPTPGTHTIVASLEHHWDHGGWHIHSKCADISEFDHTSSRQRNNGIRLPGDRSYSRPRGYLMNQHAATKRAYRVFRVRGTEEDLFA